MTTVTVICEDINHIVNYTVRVGATYHLPCYGCRVISEGGYKVNYIGYNIYSVVAI